MSFLSPRPQTPEIPKDRLGNTMPPAREPPFAVGLWFVFSGGVIAGWAGRFVKEIAAIQSEFLREATGVAVSFGALCFVNRGFNRFSWYRAFKRSPLLINGTNLILLGIVVFVCFQAATGKPK